MNCIAAVIRVRVSLHLPHVQVLQNGGSAVDAVEAAVRSLENDPAFDAGRSTEVDLLTFDRFETRVLSGCVCRRSDGERRAGGGGKKGRAFVCVGIVL